MKKKLSFYFATFVMFKALVVTVKKKFWAFLGVGPTGGQPTLSEVEHDILGIYPSGFQWN